MADQMPIPSISRPTGSPSPTLEDSRPQGLGLDGMSMPDSLNHNALSPFAENFGSATLSPISAQFPSPLSPTARNAPLSPERKNPFNFQSQPLELAKSPITKSGVGQRRGHKYKHSSVSHQIFLEPEPRAPLTLPSSLPIPTIRECWTSMNQSQSIRLYWSICHALIAGFTLFSASGSLAMTALSHLIFYDALGALLCVLVDVLSNFDVWTRSSVRHPFGLQRAEVLAGFAMSVLLLFMGMDLISHNAEHMLEGVGGHEPHVEHEHSGTERVGPGEVDAAAALAIAATLVSALLLKNHERIGKVMRLAYFEDMNLPTVLSNPSHLLTLTCSAALILLPLLSVKMYVWLDRAISGTIAVSMCVLGGRLVHTLGLMLLMSYNGTGAGVKGAGSVSSVLTDIEADPSVARVEEAKIWQVHYGLCMANLKLRVRGTDDNMARLRDRIASLVRNRLGGGYGGGGGQKWEVSTQLDMDNM